MNRAGLVIVAVVALAGGACGGGDESAASVAGPSANTGGGGGGSQTPAPGCSMPSAPSGLAASIAGTSVVLTWSAVSGASEYLILVGTSPSSSNTLSTNSTQNSYPWSGVSPGTYYARVQSKNSCGTSGSSNEAVFTITQG